MSQQINLFNPILLRQKKYFSALTMLQALGLVLAGSLLVALYAGYRSAGLRAEAERTSVQLSAALAQQARINAEFGVRQPSVAQAIELKQAGADVETLQHLFELLQTGEIGNTKGYSEYLRAFARQKTDGLWLTGLMIQGAGNAIALQGRTLQPDLVPLYINRLAREPVMQGKSFSTLEMRKPQAETAESAEGARAQSAAPAPGYIEFRLQSTAVKDAGSPAGAKLK